MLSPCFCHSLFLGLQCNFPIAKNPVLVHGDFLQMDQQLLPQDYSTQDSVICSDPVNLLPGDNFLQLLSLCVCPLFTLPCLPRCPTIVNFCTQCTLHPLPGLFQLVRKNLSLVRVLVSSCYLPSPVC